MKKFFLTFLFLIFVIIGGLGFFVIRSFNPETFQRQVVSGISDLTGREFNVLGATQVNWAPVPQIILNDVTLSNKSGSQRSVMMRANRVVVQIEWTSLLKEPLVIQKIDIENPTLFLERDSATHVNWDFPFLFADSKKDLSTDFMNMDVSQTRIDSMFIHNGTIEYVNGLAKTKWNIEKINGNLILESLQGPFTFDGTFELLKKDMTVKLNVKRLRTDSPVPFTINLVEKNNAFLFDLSGNITPSIEQTSQITADGSFSVARPNEFLKILGLKPLNTALNIPSSGSLTYESANGADMFKSFTIRFGNQEDAVAVTGSLGREEINKKLNYKATIAVNTLNYDLWKDFLSDIQWDSMIDSKRPNFNFKVNVQNFIWGKETVKDLTIDMEKRGNRFHVKGGKGILSGDTTISFEGGSLTEDGKTGLLLLVVGQSTKFKDLIAKYADVRKVAPSLLQKVGFKGNILIYPDQFTSEIESLDIDKGRISGKIAYRKTDKLPIVTAKLNVSGLDFDAYTGYKQPKEAQDITKSVVLIKDYFQDASLLKKFNGQVELMLNNIRFHMLPIGKGRLLGTMDDGTLKIEELTTQEMANASLRGKGTFIGVGTDNVIISDMNLVFGTSELGLFMRKANLKSENEFIKSVKSFETDLTLSEENNLWIMAMKNKMADLEISVNGSIDSTKDEPVYKDLNVMLTYPNFRRFVTNIVKMPNMNTTLSGLLKLNVVLNGTPKTIQFSKGTVQIGQNQLNINGSYSMADNGLLDMRITTPSFDVRKFIWNDLKNFTFTGMDAKKHFNLKEMSKLNQHIVLETNQLLYRDAELKNAKVDLSLQNQTLTINELSGILNDETSLLTAKGTFSWDNNIPKLTGMVSAKNLSLDNNLITLKNMSLGDGTLSFDSELSLSGKSPYEMLKTLSGKGKYQIRDLMWIGTNIEKVSPLIDRSIRNRVPKSIFDKALNQLLNSGKTTLESISGNFTVSTGIFKTMDTALKGNGFASDPMQVIWDIVKEEMDISMPLSLSDKPDFPPFALTIKGPLKRLLYQTNFVDLSASVSDVVQEDNAKTAKAEQMEKDRQAAQFRNEREEKAREAILEAREAVKQASGKVKNGDNQRALDLLQSAQDALDFMNNLSVKENLTDAEYMQLTEQARLAVIKAEEAVAEATNDKFFEDRKQIKAFARQAQSMQREIERIGQENPEIEIIQKLLPLTAEHVQILAGIAGTVIENETDEEHQAHFEQAKISYIKVVKGYKYVLKFDAAAQEIEPLSIEKQQNTMPETFVKVETGMDPLTGKTTQMQGQISVAREATENTSETKDVFTVTDSAKRLRNRISRTNFGAIEQNNISENIPTTFDETNQDDVIMNMTVGSGMRGTIGRAHR